VVSQAYARRLTSDSRRGGYLRWVSIPWQAPPPAGQRSQRPPLTKRLRPGHWVALDYLAAALCAVVIFVNLQRYGLGWYGLISTVMSVLIAVAVSVPVAVRRRNPMAALVVSVVAAVIGPLFAAVLAVTSAAAPVVASGANVPDIALRSAPVYFLPVVYVIYLVAALYRRAVAVAALGAVLALLAIQGLLIRLDTPFNGSAPILPALIVIIFWIVGYAAAQRRAYAAQLQDQAAAGAVTEERLRIARELHDVVAHSMTVIAVQAGYGHHVIDEQPARAREALGAIQATSREALAEMRRMLGVLRQSHPAPYIHSKLPVSGMTSSQNGADASPDGAEKPPRDVRETREAAPLAPAPGLADLDRLLARIGNAGVTVDLRVNGSRRDLPPGIDLAAFRIVQEALTNVVKHADTPSASVTISYLDDEVAIVVVDQGRGCPVPAATGARGEAGADPPGGHGLIGMRERVSLYGGELTAQPLPERGFRVAARLPVSGDAP
jgi:signal transduction histidine kinase